MSKRDRKWVRDILRDEATATVKELNGRQKTVIYFWDEIKESRKKRLGYLGEDRMVALYKIPNVGDREEEK